MSDIQALQDKLLAFAEARDWEQFQSPKNLAMAIAVEAGELMEHYQWLTEEQSRNPPDKTRDAAAYELADVFMYCLLMSKRMNIDLNAIALDKLQLNEQRYPADKVKGRAVKHTDL